LIKIEIFNLLPEFGTNTYLIIEESSQEAILVDPSAPSMELLKKVETLKLRYILNTHGHLDHIGGNSFFKKHTQATLAIHQADAIMLTDNKKNLSAFLDMQLPPLPADLLLEDGDELILGGLSFKVIHTPGHTPGCICLFHDKYLISGDTLFEQSIGRTDFPGGSFEQINQSIKTKLFVLDDDTIVFPGHGPKTSIGIEKKINPFIR